ncbi:Hypothetical_protein [Hexamita inflata]|uniref:Hypothetical_protein n=1 Tax=Hexamita inflata TaxID=28002 RepID=A0AA86P1I4_9EUKA|nr:Hypothetical protein HINF_LOCUS17030 [Hexamita inflata]
MNIPPQTILHLQIQDKLITIVFKEGGTVKELFDTVKQKLNKEQQFTLVLNGTALDKYKSEFLQKYWVIGKRNVIFVIFITSLHKLTNDRYNSEWMTDQQYRMNINRTIDQHNTMIDQHNTMRQQAPNHSEYNALIAQLQNLLENSRQRGVININSSPLQDQRLLNHRRVPVQQQSSLQTSSDDDSSNVSVISQNQTVDIDSDDSVIDLD